MVIRPLIKIGFLGACFILLCSAGQAKAEYKNERYASLERSQAAIGHYARARAMLVRALQEFEEGRKLARPDLLLDSEEWRLSVISRAEELNRVLDPKPKIVRDGARFSASPLRVERKKQQLAPLEIGPASTNTQGEDEWKRQKEIEAVRTRMSEAAKQFEVPKKPEAPVYLDPSAAKLSNQGKEITEQNAEEVSTVPVVEENTLSVGDIIPEELPLSESKAEDGLPNEQAAPTLFGTVPAEAEVGNEGPESESIETGDENYDEDAAISQAIERSIKERLMKINGGAQ